MASRGVSLAVLTHSDVHSLLSVITMRLGERNFIKWSFQFQTTLAGNGLFGYYDGTEVSPPRYALNNEGEVTNEETAAYKAWKQIDMALLSLLMTTLNEDIVDVIIDCKTSRQAWLALRQRFSARSRMSIEGSFSLHSTMSAMIARGNGQRTDERSGDTRSWNNTHDDKGTDVKPSGGSIECQVCWKRGHTVDTCFRVHKCQICGKHGHLTSTCYQNPDYKPQQTSQQQNRLQSLRPLPECQICSKKGHTAAKCFYRTDVPARHSSLSIPTCQICGLKGHVALNCIHRTNFAYQGMHVPGGFVHLSQLPTELMGDHNSTAYVVSNDSHDSNVSDQADDSNDDNNDGQNNEEYGEGVSVGLNSEVNDVTHRDIDGLSFGDCELVNADTNLVDNGSLIINDSSRSDDTMQASAHIDGESGDSTGVDLSNDMTGNVYAIKKFKKYNYIHRDIMPDNLLLDRNGHMKLSDRRMLAYSLVIKWILQRKLSSTVQCQSKYDLLSKEEAEELFKPPRGNGNSYTKICLSNSSFGLDATRFARKSETEAIEVMNLFSSALEGCVLRYLNLSDNAMGEKGVIAFESLLRSQNSLEELYLMNDGILDARSVSKFIPSTEKLRVLHFHNNMRGDKGAIVISDMVKRSPVLEDYYCFSTRMGCKGSVALAEALGTCSHLKKLDLRGNMFACLSYLNLEDEGTKALADALKDSAPLLEVLEMAGNADCSNDLNALQFVGSIVDISDIVESKTFSATGKSEWNQAMIEEIEALQKLGTWSLVLCPKQKNIVESKWMYKIMKNPDDSVSRYKARNGFHKILQFTLPSPLFRFILTVPISG